MTDGQSEAAKYIDTSHPALRKTTQERIEQNRERYEQLKRNARLAMPPWTVDDCRFMVWLLEGEWVEQRKRRCTLCGGSGGFIEIGDLKGADCERCNGTGYVQTSE